MRTAGRKSSAMGEEFSRDFGVRIRTGKRRESGGNLSKDAEDFRKNQENTMSKEMNNDPNAYEVVLPAIRYIPLGNGRKNRDERVHEWAHSAGVIKNDEVMVRRAGAGGSDPVGGEMPTIMDGLLTRFTAQSGRTEEGETAALNFCFVGAVGQMMKRIKICEIKSQTNLICFRIALGWLFVSIRLHIAVYPMKLGFPESKKYLNGPGGGCHRKQRRQVVSVEQLVFFPL